MRHYVLKICDTIQIDIWTGIQIPELYSGYKLIPNTEYNSVLR